MKITNESDGLKSCAAWGDQHADVPGGYVVVYATPGGRMGSGGKYFLVPAAEYPNASIVIDPQRHAEATGFVPMNKMASAKGSTGQAKPWGEVMRSLGTDGGVKTVEKSAGDLGGALPWPEVMRKIEASEQGRTVGNEPLLRMA